MNLKFLFKKIYNLWHGVMVFYDVCGEFTIQLDLNLTHHNSLSNDPY